jgi:phospholipid/cholesterol/gamma-HCH transport system substrate-binding protein
MNDSRFEFKVGLFVLAGLALAALLVLNFSKGITLFKSTYKLHVTMSTVAGLKPAADVMMAGVPVGKVAATTLSPDGRSVDITVEILSKYKIRKNATFRIDAMGFLGDQYIEVTPAETESAASLAPLLTNGESVLGEKPLNIQEAVHSIYDFVGQAQHTMGDIDKAVTNVTQTILAAAALTNFVTTLTNLGGVAEDAAVMAKQVRAMLDANGPDIRIAITNFAALSQKLDIMADKLDSVITTNSSDVTSAIKNLKAASASLDQLAAGLQAGQGLGGSLLKDEQMKTNFSSLLANLTDMADQFAAFGRRLNDDGIWRTLWKPKTPATNAPKH